MYSHKGTYTAKIIFGENWANGRDANTLPGEKAEDDFHWEPGCQSKSLDGTHCLGFQWRFSKSWTLNAVNSNILKNDR